MDICGYLGPAAARPYVLTTPTPEAWDNYKVCRCEEYGTSYTVTYDW